MKDGTKINLGFSFVNMPIIKTETDFVNPIPLQSIDEYALRYIALSITDQLNRIFDPDAYTYCWSENDNDNFVCENMLNLNNGYGIRCENGDTLCALYLSRSGNIMGNVIPEDETLDDYCILIC